MHKLSSMVLQTGRLVRKLTVHFIAAIRKGKKAPSAVSSCSSSNPLGEYLHRVIYSGLPQLYCGSICVALVQHISFYLQELLSAWLLHVCRSASWLLSLYKVLACSLHCLFSGSWEIVKVLSALLPR